jgi:TonB family protein
MKSIHRKLNPALVLKLLFFFCMAGCLSGYAQTTVYLTDTWYQVDTKAESTYYRTFEKKKDRYYVETFYSATDRIKERATCIAIQPNLIYDGEVTSYFENGIVKFRTSYVNGQKTGLSYAFRKNGDSSFVYFHKPGVREVKTVRVWDDTGRLAVRDGVGSYTEDSVRGNLTLHLSYKDSVCNESYSVSMETQDTVYYVTDKAIEFTGGMRAFYQTLSTILRYPEDAINDEIEGSVYVEIVIDANGSIASLQVLESLGGGCDEEALRAIRTTDKKWIPAQHRGRPVKAAVVLPVTFRLR